MTDEEKIREMHRAEGRWEQLQQEYVDYARSELPRGDFGSWSERIFGHSWICAIWAEQAMIRLAEENRDEYIEALGSLMIMAYKRGRESVTQ